MKDSNMPLRMNSFVLHLMHEELMYIRCDIVIFWQRHGF